MDAFVGILFGALATGLGIGLVERSGPPRNTIDIAELGFVSMTAFAVPYLASAATGFHLLHRGHEAGERARAGRS